MAEDIYPLGLGNGLLTDIANFALNNLYQYGQRTKDTNQRMGQDFSALSRGDSVDLSPLVHDAMSINPLMQGGIFRDLALRRQEGAMNPAEFARALMSQPRFARYKQLVENMVRKNLGDEFPVYRGASTSDPLFAIDNLNKGKLPAATAVSLDKLVSEAFAKTEGGSSRLAEIMATPESVLSLTPRRGTGYGMEKELLIDPRWSTNIATRGSSTPGYLTPSIAGNVEAEPLLDTLFQEVLGKLRDRRVIPGAGAHLEAEASRAAKPYVWNKAEKYAQSPISVAPQVQASLDALNQKYLQQSVEVPLALGRIGQEPIKLSSDIGKPFSFYPNGSLTTYPKLLQGTPTVASGSFLDNLKSQFPTDIESILKQLGM